MPWLTPLQRVAGGLGNLLVMLAFLGLIIRGGFRQCYSFAVYLFAVAAFDLVVTVSPGLYHRPFWIVREATQDALKLAIALEVTLRIFRVFPGAMIAALRWMALCLAATLVMVARGASDFVSAQPQILNGTIWVFACIGGVAVYYRLPLRPLPKAILVGFSVYLVFLSAATAAFAAFGWANSIIINSLPPWVYRLVSCYWVFACWRRVEEPEIDRISSLVEARRLEKGWES